MSVYNYNFSQRHGESSWGEVPDEITSPGKDACISEDASIIVWFSPAEKKGSIVSPFNLDLNAK